MFGSLGGPEILLILVIALIVFGPRKLPDIGKSLGKMIVEFRRAGTDFKRTIEEEVDAEKLKADLQVPLLTGPDPTAAAPVAGTVPVDGPAADAVQEATDAAPEVTDAAPPAADAVAPAPPVDEAPSDRSEAAQPTPEEAPASQGR